MHKQTTALKVGQLLKPLLKASCRVSLLTLLTLAGTATLEPRLSAIAAPVTQLNQWRFDPASNQLEVILQAGVTPRYFLMAQPARIVLELPNTRLGNVQRQQAYSGAVRQIRAAQFQPETARLVLELAPNVVLAPEQVELERVGGSGNRWVLRPVIATPNPRSTPATPARSTTPTPTPATQIPSPIPTRVLIPVPPPAAAPEQASGAKPVEESVGDGSASPTTPPSVQAAVPPTPPSIEQPAPPTSTEQPTPAPVAPPAATPMEATRPLSSEVPTPLPPRPSLALETPMPPESSLKPAAKPPVAPSTNPTPETIASPNPATESLPPAAAIVPAPLPLPSLPSESVDPPVATVAPTSPPVQDSPAESPAFPTPTIAQVPPSDIPSTLPPATFPPNQSPTVTVPPLGESTPLPPTSADFTVTAPPSTTEAPPLALPSTPTPQAAQPSVTVPPLQRDALPDLSPGRVPMDRPTPTESPVPNRSQTTAAAPVIDFGQPIPELSSAQPPAAIAQTPNPLATNVLLPAGFRLSLRYPGNAPLPLPGEQSRQEVLVLQTEIRDPQGRTIAPVGTSVIGRFETTRSGSRFVTQAIALGTRNLSLAAQSEPLTGDRQVSENRLLINSGIGALAGGILGGFSGFDVLGGAAAGAAVTYLIAPKPATIQPGQTFQVQLTEDLQR